MARPYAEWSEEEVARHRERSRIAAAKYRKPYSTWPEEKQARHREHSRQWKADHPGTAHRGLPTIGCVICGAQFVKLGHHLQARHGTNAREYREKFNAPTCSSSHAGITRDNLDDRGLKPWSREAIIIAFRRWHRRTGYVPRSTTRRPTRSFWQRGDGLRPLPTRPTVIKYFGSWDEALTAAGLEREPRRRKLRRTCLKGHRLTPENTIIRANGYRRCRTCRLAYQREWVARRAAA